MEQKQQKCQTNRPTAEAMKDAKILKLHSSCCHSDILGSYTGTAADGDVPEQDADDL